MMMRAFQLEVALRNLIAQIELHTDCMTGLIDADALIDWTDEAEEVLRTTSFWKSVEEELPDADTTVLVCTEDCAEPVWLGYYDGEVWRDIDSLPIKVTRWCDLPESAKATAG